MSFFIASKVEAAFVFGNGVWTLNQDYYNGCASGANAHANFTETMALPQPPQNPITRFPGTVTGTWHRCRAPHAIVRRTTKHTPAQAIRA